RRKPRDRMVAVPGRGGAPQLREPAAAPRLGARPDRSADHQGGHPMSTTDVVIEQVLTGFLILAIVCVPFLPEHLLAYIYKLPSGITLGVVATGAAYMLGVPFDRFADTLTDGLEHRHRLRFAWNECRKNPLQPDNPFPEDALRFGLLARGSTASLTYFQYLRSRIRIARSLAVYVPALTVSAMLRSVPASRAVASGVLVGLSVFYGIATSPWGKPHGAGDLSIRDLMKHFGSVGKD